MVPKYNRVDIQALRAFAVISVVLYHAQVPGFSGGYYGVDIFFVISGFLITGILCRELQATNSLDLVAFWKRRAWRLLPNALTVLLVCLVLAVTVGPITQRQSVVIDVASALVYVGNYRFLWRAVDYFDDSVATSPVLHFWSLGVEEQYYLLWPLLFLFAWTRPPTKRAALAVLASAVILISIGMTAYWTTHSQPHVFFSTETRMWQLASGGLLAILLQGRELSGASRSIALWVGLVGLAASIIGADRWVHWAEIFAIVPVISTVLVIASGAGNSGLAGRLAAAAPIIWIGARSYSIYLWHWPILVYGSHLFGHSGITSAALVGLTLWVSAAAYRFIETPFRIGHGGSSGQRRPLRWLAAPSVCVALTALAITLSPSVRGATGATVAERLIAAKADTPQLSRPDCLNGWRTDPQNSCVFGDKGMGRPRVMLVGDSYAEHFFDGLDAAATRAGWSLIPLLQPACSPTVDILVRNPQTGVINMECRHWLDAILDRIERDKPDLVLIATAGLIAAPMVDPKTGKVMEKSIAMPLWQRAFAGFVVHVERSAASTIVIPGTPMGRFEDYESCMTDAPGNQCGLPRAKALSRSDLIEEAARKVEGVEILDLADRFCGPNVCYGVINGVIVYRDAGHHLTATFARTLEPVFEEVLRGHATRGRTANRPASHRW